ncbi:hypothetical protein CSKR_106820 [Clonorchis sinensis]|uniref:Uncharacterized protein n=1 Tax=Clonorchis sinensis TaxID=79923 RepID=A0A3R7GZJ3_CLOSI|nr:hypothetical protein CSKR_106820 [Clonorchis sinensis]
MENGLENLKGGKSLKLVSGGCDELQDLRSHGFNRHLFSLSCVEHTDAKDVLGRLKWGVCPQLCTATGSCTSRNTTTLPAISDLNSSTGCAATRPPYVSFGTVFEISQYIFTKKTAHKLAENFLSDHGRFRLSLSSSVGRSVILFVCNILNLLALHKSRLFSWVSLLVVDQAAVDLFAELGNWLANVSSPYEETSSVRSWVGTSSLPACVYIAFEDQLLSSDLIGYLGLTILVNLLIRL